jgi:hypothetical protein
MVSSELHPDRAAVIFNGDYLVSSPKTGETFKVKIRTQSRDSRFHPGERVAKLFVKDDPDDPFSWEGFAFVTDRGIHVWRSKKGKPADPGKVRKPSVHERLARILWDLEVDGEASRFHDEGYKIEAVYRCILCNRPLAATAALETGIGQICAGRRKPNKKKPEG